MDQSGKTTINLTINNEKKSANIDPRSLLVESIREDFNLKGTNIGCLTGDCGACTIVMDGKISKSCLTLAVSAEGSVITTIEGMAKDDELHPIQQSFWEKHGFQCGYCLPGMMFSAQDLLNGNPDPTEEEIRESLNGNLCRCTGYQKTVESVVTAAKLMK